MKRASGEAPRSRRAACSALCDGRADRGVDDALLGDLVALERRDGVAAGHDDHAVAQPLELLASDETTTTGTPRAETSRRMR